MAQPSQHLLQPYGLYEISSFPTCQLSGLRRQLRLRPTTPSRDFEKLIVDLDAIYSSVHPCFRKCPRPAHKGPSSSHISAFQKPFPHNSHVVDREVPPGHLGLESEEYTAISTLYFPTLELSLRSGPTYGTSASKTGLSTSV